MNGYFSGDAAMGDAMPRPPSPPPVDYVLRVHENDQFMTRLTWPLPPMINPNPQMQWQPPPPGLMTDKRHCSDLSAPLKQANTLGELVAQQAITAARVELLSRDECRCLLCVHRVLLNNSYQLHIAGDIGSGKPNGETETCADETVLAERIDRHMAIRKVDDEIARADIAKGAMEQRVREGVCMAKPAIVKSFDDEETADALGCRDDLCMPAEPIEDPVLTITRDRDTGRFSIAFVTVPGRPNMVNPAMSHCGGDADGVLEHLQRIVPDLDRQYRQMDSELATATATAASHPAADAVKDFMDAPDGERRKEAVKLAEEITDFALTNRLPSVLKNSVDLGDLLRVNDGRLEYRRIGETGWRPIPWGTMNTNAGSS